jgi:hypothetical protein
MFTHEENNITDESSPALLWFEELAWLAGSAASQSLVDMIVETPKPIRRFVYDGGAQETNRCEDLARCQKTRRASRCGSIKESSERASDLRELFPTKFQPVALSLLVTILRLAFTMSVEAF